MCLWYQTCTVYCPSIKMGQMAEVESPLQYWISPQRLQVARFSSVLPVISAIKWVPISGIFRRAHLPPLARPWKFFTGDFIWKGAFFAIFQQELQNSTMFYGLLFPNFRKMGEFAVSIEHSEAKGVSASGGLRPPLTSRPRALPLDPTGGSAPRPPLYARAPRARHGPPFAKS